MGLNGYMLWLWVNLIQPAEPHRGVTVQVVCESKGLKPFFFALYAQGLKPGPFKLWVN
jgi:hypothetical protein